jgi:L-threonylcarbamoyladenylate synthase
MTAACTVCDSSAVTKFAALADPSALDDAVGVVRAGGTIVLPTDTVYGLGTSPASIAKLYALKDRPDSVPIAVLVAAIGQADELVTFTETAARIGAALWPGPLTMVLARRDGEGTLGVRLPDHEFVTALARSAGPLAVTSANRHGAPTPPNARDAAAALTGTVDLVVDGGPCSGVASTVVDLTQGDVVILRTGTITEEQIRAAALR